jgi:hypothetical protein
MEDAIVTNAFLSQFTASGIIVWILQKLKEAPWFSLWTAKTSLAIQRAFGATAAAASAFAINITFDSAEGVLVITGLTLAGVGGAVWAWVQSFVMQQWWYHDVFKPAPPVASSAIVHPSKG